MDIFTTRVNGKTSWTPGPRTSDETLPKKSFTPTWPAGITATGFAGEKEYENDPDDRESEDSAGPTEREAPPRKAWT